MFVGLGLEWGVGVCLGVGRGGVKGRGGLGGRGGHCWDNQRDDGVMFSLKMRCGGGTCDELSTFIKPATFSR